MCVQPRFLSAAFCFVFLIAVTTLGAKGPVGDPPGLGLMNTPSVNLAGVARTVPAQQQDAGDAKFLQDQHAAEETLKRARGAQNADGECRALRGLGILYMNWGRYLDGQNRFEEAKPKRELSERYSREAVDQARAGNLPFDMALALHNLGSLYSDWKRPESSKDQLSEAIRLFQTCDESQFLARNYTKEGVLGLCFSDLGTALKDLKDIQGAADAWESAVTNWRKSHDTRISIPLMNLGQSYFDLHQWDRVAERLESLLNMAPEPRAYPESLDHILVSYLALGRYDDVLQRAPMALESWKKVDGLYGTAGIGRTQQYIATAYMNLASYSKARDCIDQAVKTFTRPAHDFEIAECYLTRSVVDLALYDPSAALIDCERAKQIAAGVQPESARLNLNLHYDLLKSEIGPYVKPDGMPHNTKALALLAVILNSQVGSGKTAVVPHGVVAGAILRFDDLFQSGRYQGALNALQEAEKPFLGLNSPQYNTLYHRLRGECLSRMGQTAAACDAFQEALKSYEAFRQHRKEPSEWGSLQESVAFLYQSYARVLFDAQRYEDSLCIVERGRAQGLLRQVIRNKAISPGFVTQAVPPLSEWQSAYRGLKNLAHLHPDTLYLEIAVVDQKQSLIYALSNKGLRASSFPAGETVLEQQTERWRTKILESAHNLAAISEERQASFALYKTLFGRLEKDGALNGITRLVVVADGPLMEVPFAALAQDAKATTRLIDRFSISETVSLGMLNWPETPREPNSVLLCAADPLGDVNRTFDNPTRAGYGKLLWSRKEGEEIRKMVPGTTYYAGFRAKKSVVIPQMRRYAFLHFATHGVLDAHNGLRSALVFAPENATDTRYEVLEAREISGMALAARMAVLSACGSGQGQKSGGEGLLGLVWAFRAAGCPSIVASRWQVNDAATEQLMVAFYSGLMRQEKPMRKDDALRAAMQMVRKERGHISPYYWAAFQVIGDAGPVNLKLR